MNQIDSVEELLLDFTQWGQIEELRRRLCRDCPGRKYDARTAVCTLVTELAASADRDLAVDLLLYAAGLDVYEGKSLRDYAAKHGCSHEWFRQQAEACRQRLGLPPSGPRQNRAGEGEQAADANAA